MATQLQLRRGNTNSSQTFTGAVGEVTVNTQTHELTVHDGITVGGYTLAKKSDVYTKSEIDANYISTKNITNCITEIPQDVKLELFDNNGTTTLKIKAGSVFYVPNGDNFDKITLENDKLLGFIGGTSGTVTTFVCLSSVDSGVLASPLDQTFSGNSEPIITTNYAVWYDTTNNQVKWTSNHGGYWSTNWSLPLCTIISENGYIQKIDRGR